MLIPLINLPSSQFLTSLYNPFPELSTKERVTQERFYRAMRRHFNILVDEHGEPMEGQWNFDKQNRKNFPADILIPEPVYFAPDTITKEVINTLSTRFPWTKPSATFDLAVSHTEAQQAANDFIQTRLKYFGTYEDAMTMHSGLLFHSKLSPYLNLGLLHPLDLVRQVQEAYLSGKVAINNAEGFIRQVMGWREYTYWQYQRLMPGLAASNYFQAHKSLPEIFWTGDTEMNCLRHVLKRSLEDGYVHHIERLMLLSNYCLLTGVAPKEVLGWFQSVFIDAYDWVMVPNIMGMGLYADGGMIGSKPYIASANYIHKMGDYCEACPYDYKGYEGEKACPFNYLFWNFLLEHEQKLRTNFRMARMLYTLKLFNHDKRLAIRKMAETVL